MDNIIVTEIQLEFTLICNQLTRREINRQQYYMSKIELFKKYIAYKQEFIYVMDHSSRCFLDGFIPCYDLDSNSFDQSCSTCLEDIGYSSLLRRLNHYQCNEQKELLPYVRS